MSGNPILLKPQNPLIKRTQSLEDQGVKNFIWFGQNWLIHRMQSLGYKKIERGICHGLACMAMQAVLANDINRFNNRLQRISDIPLSEFPEKIEVIRKKRITIVNDLKQALLEELKKNGQLEKGDLNQQQKVYLNQKIIEAFEKDNDALLFDVLNFFDGVKNYQHSYQNKGLYGKNRLFFQSIEHDKELTQSKFFEQNNGLTLIDNQICGIYDKLDIDLFFSSFRDALQNSHQIKSPVTLFITSLDHAIQISYSPTNDIWFFFDANKMPIIRLTSYENLCGLLQLTFRTGILRTQIYASNQAEEIKNQLKLWKSTDTFKNLHTFSTENKFSKESLSILLRLAVQAGITATLEELLELPIDINLSIYGYTPLGFAAMIGNLDAVNLLLKHQDIDLNESSDADYKTPIYYAASNGFYDIVKILLQKGANPSLVHCLDFEKLSPLHVAAQNGYHEIVKLLLDSNQVKPNEVSKDIEGSTPLIKAVINGQIDVVKTLLENKYNVDINLLSRNGKSPLYYAVEKGNLELINLLLAHNKIDPNSSKSETPLILAARTGNIKIVKSLLSHHTYPDTIKQGKTALLVAAKEGHYDIVTFLLEHDPNPDITLLLAAKEGLSDVVKYLLENGVNPNFTNQKGESVLMEMAKRGDLNMVIDLLKKGANPYYISINNPSIRKVIVDVLEDAQSIYSNLQKFKQALHHFISMNPNSFFTNNSNHINNKQEPRVKYLLNVH